MCVFLHGEKVAQDLGRVGFVGQSIPHWHTGIAGKLFHFRLRKSAILDAIIHPAQDPGSILHGFLAPDMGATWAYVGDIGPYIGPGGSHIGSKETMKDTATSNPL